MLDGIADPPADLKIDGVTVTVAGSTATLSGRLCAAGPTPPVDLLLELDPPTAPACPYPDSRRVQVWEQVASDGAGCLPFSVPLTDLPNGHHEILMQVDARCRLDEPDESNNRATAMFKVAARLSDFYVASLASRVEPSGLVTVAGELCHRGDANRTVMAALWVDRPTIPNICKPPAAPLHQTPVDLPLNGCVTFATTLTGLSTGAHTARVALDTTCLDRELDEANNTALTAFVIP